jgi:hypothetical protein
MQLDDTRGCPGYWLHLHGRTAGICLTCSRLERGGPQIAPAAVRLYGGLMVCMERRNDGHALTVALDARDDQHLRCGGAVTTTPLIAGVRA